MFYIARFELVACRIAIQLCVGHFPDGRARHRTVSIQNVRSDLTADEICAFVRAVSPLLAHPVAQVHYM